MFLFRTLIVLSRVKLSGLNNILHTTTTRSHTSKATAQLQPVKFEVVYQCPFRLRAILSMASNMTKEDIITELARFGELPPKTWSKMEMLTRMEELRVQAGMSANPKGKRRTPLRQMVVRLNEAARKKADLAQFVTKELGVTVTPNDTIKNMQQKGLAAIYDYVEASPEDAVGFGEHSALSYHEVMIRFPKYIEWVQDTYKEGQCCSRLARLARWSLALKEKDTNMAPSKEISRQELIQMGYIRESKNGKGGASVTSAASETSTVKSNSTEEVMLALAQSVKELTEEVKTLKEEQKNTPRKKAHSSSDGSFERLP